MSRRLTLITVCLAATVAFFIGVLSADRWGAGLPEAGAPGSGPAVARTISSSSTASPSPIGTGTVLVNFADIAARLNPTVVSIDATSEPAPGADSSDRSSRRGAPRRNGDQPEEGTGSGFIISADGSILTNNHVIDHADRITVTLADGRRVHARVVGADPDTDVALIRIDPSGPLPVAPLGDSSRLRVGDWVCAIGNPMNYSHSVTVGVVSFLGRKLFDSSLDNYIQTDAAINLGSSGGPLINTQGQVIGINAAISWRARDIGFAVPINVARAILPQLRAHGRVARGYIGVTLKTVDPDLQRSLKLAVARGALVQDVTPDSPGDRAGLRPYDLIVAVDGREVTDNDELIRQIADHQPGTEARLQIYRDGHPEDVVVRLGQRPDGQRVSENRPGGDTTDGGSAQMARIGSDVGLTVRLLDSRLVQRFGLPGGMKGVMVSRVNPIGPSYEAGIEPGNVILEINRQKVRTVDDYSRIVRAARPGDVLTFYLYNPELNQRVLHTVRIDGP